MAPKKINPAKLAQLAAIDAKTKAPLKPTTPRVNNSTPPDDTLPGLPSVDEIIYGSTTTTTVPGATTTTTTVPQPIIPSPKGTKTGTLSDKIIRDINAAEAALLRTNRYTPQEVENIKTGQQKKKGFWGTVGGFGGTILNYGLAKPIMALDRFDNLVPALIEGSIKNAKVIAGGGEERYTNWSEIPRNIQTGVPISRPGELKIKNTDDYVNFRFDMGGLGSEVKFMPTAVAKQLTFAQSRELGTVDKTKKYKNINEIPVNVQTLQPIAKVGDYVYSNGEMLANLELRSNPEGYLLPSDITDTLIQEVVKPTAKFTRAITDPGEVIERTGDPSFGYGSIEELQTGNQWVDRTTGLIGDIFGSPSTYLTAGTSVPAKLSLRTVGLADDALTKITSRAAESLARDGFSQTIKIIEKEVALELGEKVGSRVANRTAAAIVSEAGQLAVERATTEAAKKAVAKAARQATSYWSAVGPRRVLGASAREGLAIGIKNLRDEAQQTAIRYAGQAEGRIAENFVKAMTDDVIGDIASKGYSAFNKKIVVDGVKTTVGKALGIPGGLRLGVGTAKATIPGTKYLQAPVGKAAYLGRKGLYEAGKVGKVIPGLRQPIGDLLTGLGRGGLPVPSDVIFNARTGLRSGATRGAAAVSALELLAEDSVYRTLKKTTANSIRPAISEIFKTYGDKESRRTVYQILEIPLDQLLLILSKSDNLAARELSARLGRNVSVQEVQLSRQLSNYISELFKSTEYVARGLGTETNTFAKMLDDFGKGKLKTFPQVLSDKAVGFLGRKHLGRVRVVEGIEYTVDELIELTLRGLGHDTRLLPGQSIINELEEGTFWFGKRLTQEDIDLGIDHLNQLAKDRLGIKFNILDTNAVSAIIKYSKKFADDYAFLARLQQYAGTTPSATKAMPFGGPTAMPVATPGGYVPTTPLYTSQPFAVGMSVAAGLREVGVELLSYALDRSYLTKAQIENIATRLSITPAQVDEIADELLNRISMPGRTSPGLSLREIEDVVNNYSLQRNLDTWSIPEFDATINEIAGQIKELTDIKAGKIDFPSGLSVNELDDRIVALADLEEITNVLNSAKAAGDNVYTAWQTLRADLADNYRAFFTRSPKDVQRFLTKIDAEDIKNMLNLVEDTYIALDNMIIPDAAAKVEIAAMFKNVRRLKDPTFRGNAVSVLKDINRYVKTWAVTSPGFHTRNSLSNMFQLIAAGANLTNVKDGFLVLNRWNKFAKENALKSGALADPTQLVDDFIASGAVPKRLQPATRAALLDSGSVGFGDVEEVFGMTIPERTGVLGKEVPVRTGPIGSKVSAVSTALGAAPRLSRQGGAIIENYSRFILTFDGVRQGLDPLQSAARTNRFLFDYEDLSRLDEIATSVVPFWIWMSRNLPLQFQEMWYNPKLYKQYQEFRRSLEDEDGNNVLMPDYLEKSGAFKTFFGGSIYARPDFGIPSIGGMPGTGSPSPLQTGVSDWRSIVSAIPAASLTSALLGTDPRYGTPLREEGQGFFAPDVLRNIGTQLGGPVNAAGRAIEGAPYIGAYSDWGALSPLQEAFGVAGPTTSSGYARENSQTQAWQRALASWLGVPLTTVGPDQEISALYDQLARLRQANQG